MKYQSRAPKKAPNKNKLNSIFLVGVIFLLVFFFFKVLNQKESQFSDSRVHRQKEESQIELGHKLDTKMSAPDDAVVRQESHHQATPVAPSIPALKNPIDGDVLPQSLPEQQMKAVHSSNPISVDSIQLDSAPDSKPNKGLLKIEGTQLNLVDPQSLPNSKIPSPSK